MPLVPWGNRKTRRSQLRGIRPDDRVEWRHPIYKFVPNEFSDYVERGSIRIGNLYEFSDHEDERRRDENEYKLETNLSGICTDIPAHRSFLESTKFVDLSNLDGKVTLKNVKIVDQGPNLYCCCFSKSLADFDQFQDGTVFEIFNPIALALALRKIYKCLGDFCIAPVQYKLNKRSLDSPEVQLSPFMKLPKFEFENEVRIIWLPTRKTCPLSIVVKPSMEVAKLIKRVR